MAASGTTPVWWEQKKTKKHHLLLVEREIRLRCKTVNFWFCFYCFVSENQLKKWTVQMFCSLCIQLLFSDISQPMGVSELPPFFFLGFRVRDRWDNRSSPGSQVREWEPRVWRFTRSQIYDIIKKDHNGNPFIFDWPIQHRAKLYHNGAEVCPSNVKAR